MLAFLSPDLFIAWPTGLRQPDLEQINCEPSADWCKLVASGVSCQSEVFEYTGKEQCNLVISDASTWRLGLPRFQPVSWSASFKNEKMTPREKRRITPASRLLSSLVVLNPSIVGMLPMRSSGSLACGCQLLPGRPRRDRLMPTSVSPTMKATLLQLDLPPPLRAPLHTSSRLVPGTGMVAPVCFSDDEERLPICEICHLCPVLGVLQRALSP